MPGQIALGLYIVASMIATPVDFFMPEPLDAGREVIGR